MTKFKVGDKISFKGCCPGCFCVSCDYIICPYNGLLKAYDVIRYITEGQNRAHSHLVVGDKDRPIDDCCVMPDRFTEYKNNLLKEHNDKI